jgi:transcriptional regulator with XRE-family HTH domain
METHPLEAWRTEEGKRRGKPFRRRDAAGEIGCSPARYTQITRHNETPSMSLAKKIEAHTGIPIDVLAKHGASQ